jgi:hypothetical protein
MKTSIRNGMDKVSRRKFLASSTGLATVLAQREMEKQRSPVV